MKPNFEGLGLEAIDFQRNKSLQTMIHSYVDIIRGTSNSVMMVNLLSDMSKDIFKATGMTVQLHTHNDPSHDNIIVTFQPLSKSHPLMTKMVSAILAASDKPFKALNISSVLNGGVDLAKGTVFGDYSKVVSTLFMSVSFLNNKELTSGEITGLIIHELGHIHNYFEFLGQTFITNYLLHETSRVWLGAYPKEKRIELLNGIEKQNNTIIGNKEELAANDDPSLVEAVINNSSINMIRSELNTKFYDRRTMEFLADQFAIRHGVGRDLVTAQDKHHRSKSWLFRDTAFRTTSSMVVANLIKLSLIMTANVPLSVAARGGLIALAGTKVGISSGLAASQGVVAAVAAGVVRKTILSVGEGVVEVATSTMSTWLMQLFVDRGQALYDKPADRFAATRREMVSDLKTQGLAKEYVASVLDDIKIIDAVIEKMNNLGMVDKMLYEYIISSFKGDRKEIKLQQQYEKLSNNQLFQQAAKLSTLDAKE